MIIYTSNTYTNAIALICDSISGYIRITWNSKPIDTRITNKYNLLFIKRLVISTAVLRLLHCFIHIF